MLLYLPSLRPMTTFTVIRQPLGVSKTPGSLSSEVITTEWRVLCVCIPYYSCAPILQELSHLCR